MANIIAEIQAIETASRGEEVRDSIIDALNKINGGINYINSLPITINSTEEDSTVFTGGYSYNYELSGITANTFAFICLDSLTSFYGRYAVESLADAFKIHFDTEPSANLTMTIYYFTEGEYPESEDEEY